MKVVLKRQALYRFVAEGGWSINQFGRMAGLKHGHLSQLLSGRRQPSPNTRTKLLRAIEQRSPTPVGFDTFFEIESAAVGPTYSTAQAVLQEAP
jgi:transcriptional regulator with XRE-family HTH domain